MGRFTTSIKRWSTLRLVAFGIVAAAAIYASAQTFELSVENRETLQRVEQETANRLNESCTRQENEQAERRRSLEITYDYLLGLNAEQLRQPLNRLILVELPRAEAEAAAPVASFCNEEGVGLPEPDPELPSRPAAIDDLIPSLPQDLRNPDRRG